MRQTYRPFLTGALAALLCTACAGTDASSGSTSSGAETTAKYYLAESAVTYTKDLESGGWTESLRETFEYENGWPTIMKRYENGETEPSEHTFSYTFEDGLPAELTETDKTTGTVTRTEYNEGRRWHSESSNPSGLFSKESFYQYGLGGPFFTGVLHAGRENSMDRESDGSSSEEIDSVNLTLENGLLKQTVNSGLYANWNDGDEKEWMRFNGTYTADYENGIVSHTSVVYRAGPPGAEYEYALKQENGLVTEAVTSIRMPDQDPEETEKIVFTYTEVETDQARYTAMINYFLMHGGENFYSFNWY